MFENTDCNDCQLASRAIHPCMSSQGDVNCKLAIYLDSPAYIEDRRGRSFIGDNALFVKYCLERMGLKEKDVYLDYIVKCCPGKMPGKKDERMACVRECSKYRFASLQALTRLKAMVVLGSLGCEAITLHKTIGDRAGAEWEPASPKMRQLISHVWVGLSPGLLKEKPAEAGAIYRVIWKAAEEAGFKPHVVKMKPYDFQII